MNPDPSKLRHQQRHEHATELTNAQKQSVQEFSSVEELIRHDAEQTQPPTIIADRLNASIAREPKPARSWWRRWFSARE